MTLCGIELHKRVRFRRGQINGNSGRGMRILRRTQKGRSVNRRGYLRNIGCRAAANQGTGSEIADLHIDSAAQAREIPSLGHAAAVLCVP